MLVNGTPITDTMVKDVVKSLIATHERAPSSDEIAQLTEAAIESLDRSAAALRRSAGGARCGVSDEDVKREIAKSIGPGRRRRSVAEAAAARSGFD